MTMAERVVGVLRLDAKVYEDIEHDSGATTQALVVVIVASAAAGIGRGLQFGPLALVAGSVAAVVGWIMWAGLTFVLGTKVFSEPETRTNMGELLRVIGFSYAPTCFMLLVNVPVLGRLVGPLVAFWLLATTIIAVRQALDYQSTARAFAVVFIGWLVFVGIQAAAGSGSTPALP
jgi:hypothetical protein